VYEELAEADLGDGKDAVLAGPGGVEDLLKKKKDPLSQLFCDFVVSSCCLKCGGVEEAGSAFLVSLLLCWILFRSL
jgi:hypothetical protein